MSNNLDIPQLAPTQNNKTVTINDQKAAIDAALTEVLDVDVSGGNETVTDADYRRAIFIRIAGADATGREVQVPPIKRLVVVAADAGNIEDVTVVRGAATLVLAPGARHLIYTDGTTDGLMSIAGSV
jgi:hypothetical protein